MTVTLRFLEAIPPGPWMHAGEDIYVVTGGRIAPPDEAGMPIQAGDLLYVDRAAPAEAGGMAVLRRDDQLVAAREAGQAEGERLGTVTAVMHTMDAVDAYWTPERRAAYWAKRQVRM